MKISILYTLSQEVPISSNPGDDIVKDGQKYLVEKYIDPSPVYNVINRNKPITVIKGMEKVNLHGKLLWGLYPFVNQKEKDKLYNSDILINASGPLMYRGRRAISTLEPWFYALFVKRLAKDVENNAKFFNLAFGDNFQKGYPLKGFDKYLIEKFVHKICETSFVISARSPIAQDILRGFGHDVPLIPCTSLLARKYYNIEPSDGKYVVLNFYPTGNRSNPDAMAVSARWTDVMLRFVKYLAEKDIPYKFVYHEKAEEEFCKEAFGHYAVGCKPESVKEFLSIMSKAICGIVNRVHGGYALASFGKMATVVGSDTRLEMPKFIGLKARNVSSVTFEDLLYDLDEGIKKQEENKRMLLPIIEETENKYHELLTNKSLRG